VTEANKNLVLRAVSAGVLLPVVLVLLWMSPQSTAGLLGVCAALCAWEFYTIALKGRDAAQLLGVLAAAALPVLLVLWPERFPHLALAGAGALLIVVFSYYLLAGPLPEAPVRVSMVFTGVFYCGLLFSAAAGLRAQSQGFQWVFLLVVLTFGNDTGAYAAGRTFGRHKLYPAVSPGKTWEGFFGGMLAALAGAFVARATFLPELTVADVFLVAIPTSVLGPLGDLSESMLKRAYGVKDSGKIIPGHGGLLDRVDALLFNAPYLYLYVLLPRT